MIYRITVILVALVTFGCWGGEFRSSDDLFEEPGSDAATSTESTSGTTSSGHGGSGTDTVTVTATATSGGPGGSSGTATDANSENAISGTGGSGPNVVACAPPTDIPDEFSWQDFEASAASCDASGRSAVLTCIDDSCGTVVLVHESELIEADDGPLRLRISYQPWAVEIPMNVACVDSYSCDFQLLHDYENQVYYVELEQTEFGYGVKRFYHYTDENNPDKPGVTQLTMRFVTLGGESEYCNSLGGNVNAMGEFWKAYVAWILSLEWEC